MTPDMIEIEIKDLAFNGKAIGNLESGKVIFLDRGLPGEKVLAEVVQSRPRYDVGRVHDIIVKSDLRVPPVCSHFGSCGGCTWQDLAYSQQIEFKRKQVAGCIEHIGGLDDVKLLDVIGSAERFHYRNKMEFSFHTAEDGGFTLGLHRRGRFDEVFDLEKCFLHGETADRIVHWVRDFVKQEGIPVYDVKEHTGFIRFLVIRATRRTGEIMVNIVTNYGEIPSWQKLMQGIRDNFPEVTTLVHNQNGQKSNIATGEIERVIFGLGYIEEKLFNSTFRIRANSFFQTNTTQTETLYRAGFDMLNPTRQDRVLDLYCGTGSIGILLAPHVREVIGVELVEDAVNAARENAILNEVKNINFYQGFVKDFLKTEIATKEPFDAIIIDPPRAGLHPKALKQILSIRPPKILYISCNPATFARDAKKLVESGYKLPAIKPIDMFPHTMHVELVGVFYDEKVPS